jgi:RNA polymerase sigma factor for flagellar operon FliA
MINQPEPRLSLTGAEISGPGVEGRRARCYARKQSVGDSGRTTIDTCPAPTRQERNSLILEYLPQVQRTARRIRGRLPANVSMEDLLSSGILGLIAAIDDFDSSLNVKLKTFAEFRIRGAMLDMLRQLDWAPRRLRKMGRETQLAIATLEQRLRRNPAEDEVAAELSISLTEYQRRVLSIERLQVTSLEAASESSEPRFRLSRSVVSPESDSPERKFERSERARSVEAAIKRIPARERKVLILFYKENFELGEIAAVFGLHVSRISQLKNQAIQRLRSTLMPKAFPTGQRQTALEAGTQDFQHGSELERRTGASHARETLTKEATVIGRRSVSGRSGTETQAYAASSGELMAADLLCE